MFQCKSGSFSPAGPKPLQKRAAKGLKIGGHGCNIKLILIKFPQKGGLRDRIAWQVGYGWGLGVAGRGRVAPQPRSGCIRRLRAGGLRKRSSTPGPNYDIANQQHNMWGVRPVIARKDAGRRPLNQIISILPCLPARRKTELN